MGDFVSLRNRCTLANISIGILIQSTRKEQPYSALELYKDFRDGEWSWYSLDNHSGRHGSCDCSDTTTVDTSTNWEQKSRARGSAPSTDTASAKQLQFDGGVSKGSTTAEPRATSPKYRVDFMARIQSTMITSDVLRFEL
jgi:hypothetical protein